jgi:hypothetical protein
MGDKSPKDKEKRKKKQVEKQNKKKAKSGTITSILNPSSAPTADKKAWNNPGKKEK